MKSNHALVGLGVALLVAVPYLLSQGLVNAAIQMLPEFEAATGIKLTESFAMWPGSSVSGLYFAHPEARYFAVGKLGRDQVIDYHVRKGMPLADVERWLGPYLGYNPAEQNFPANARVACACGLPH